MASWSATLSLFNETGSWDTAGLGRNLTIAFPATGSESGHLAWILTGSNISLDGDPPISFASLPSGFRLTNIRVRREGTASTAVVSVRKTPSGNVSTATLALGTYSSTLSAGSGCSSAPLVPTFNFPPPSILNLLSVLTLDGSITCNTGDNCCQVNAFTDAEFFGTYFLESFSWTISVVGDNIQITSDGATPDLTTVDKIILNYTDADGNTQIIEVEDFDTQTAILILFAIPEFCEFTGSVLAIAQIGTTFIVIGSITV